ncbi:hypothetical protein NQ314_013887 [Rhamnusium bicolor]|uniref:Uncharacterized protein n=1 Tax=Rhamnusium bicolor TaxID=1586634 RepID=A0AAV8X5F8_9CUCU|nr:hypothetical protein NQ314_013887 [Rhamnusium bicolor]
MGKSCLICNNRFEKGSNKSFYTDDDADSADSEKENKNIGETSKKKVQFMPDVTKHVPIVGTSSESDGLGEEEIPKKRRKPLPRYFGDCSSDDMNSPRRAKRSWAIATKTISQLKARVRKFRRENYILKSRVDSLTSLFSYLRTNNYLNKSAEAVI